MRSQMEVRALREYSDGELLPLFEQEAASWEKHLSWNYRPTQRVIRKFIANRTLPGFVLSHEERPVGYAYFVVDGPVAFIGNIFVLGDFSTLESYRLLADRTVSALRRFGRIRRIEGQLFGFNQELKPIFEGLGFEAPKRLFLSSALDSLQIRRQGRNQASASSFRIKPWEPYYLSPVSDVIYSSYVGSQDAYICSDYQTRAGCLRFLRNLTENPSCGLFLPALTLVAEDESGSVCGLLLATRIGKTTGMIPQLSIRRDCQGKGLGQRMLHEYMRRAAREGFERVTLSVTESNRVAHHLYRKFGFRLRKEFYAFLWKRDK